MLILELVSFTKIKRFHGRPSKEIYDKLKQLDGKSLEMEPENELIDWFILQLGGEMSKCEKINEEIERNLNLYPLLNRFYFNEEITIVTFIYE